MKNKKTIIILIALAIVVITVGVSYSFFSYIKNGNTMNSITTGSITFHYKEITGVGAGISIEEALPISDSEGKSQNKYFDFKITSKSNVSQVPYVVTANATGNVELGEIIKVYLTELVGGNEQQLLLDTYNNLADATFITNRSDKVLYRDTVPMNNSNYEKNFRLRMWMATSANLATQICSIEPSINTTESLCSSAGGTWEYKYNNKEFSIRVNVYTNDGSSLTENNITTPDDTSLSMITANNTYLFTDSNDNGVDYEVSVPNEVSDIVLNITERNVLATSTITELGQTLSYLDSPKLKRITNSNSYSLLKGNNYFKIRVTSQNLEETEDYIIKVIREKDRNNDLSSLSIEGYAFNEPFDKDTTTYTVSLEESSITLVGNKASDVASINANDLGVKQLNWGNNQFTVTVTAENNTSKVYTINVNNVRPTAPHVIGGTNGETISEDRNITIDSPGTAISGVAYYEYYKSNTNTPPTNATEGTVLNSPYSLTVSDNGTSYIWYRTVSNKGNKSEWTEEPEEVIIDRTYTATFTGSNVTFSSSTKSIVYGDTTTITITPSSDYYISTGSCTNGYTITDLITGHRTGPQTITINNNNNIGNTTCTFTTEVAPAVTEIRPVSATSTSNYSSTYTPAKAYDNNGNTAWLSYGSDSAQSITFDMGEVKRIESIKWKLRVAGSAYFPGIHTVNFYGKNSEEDDETLFHTANINIQVYNMNSNWENVYFPTNTEYRYYRIQFSKSGRIGSGIIEIIFNEY